MKQRIGSQLLVIINVFVAERQTIDPLGQHLLNRMLNPLRLPSVEKTAGESRQQLQPLFSLSQKQRATIGRDGPAVNTGPDLTSSATLKSETGLDTLCRKQRPFSVGDKCSVETQLGHEGRLFATWFVRNAG